MGRQKSRRSRSNSNCFIQSESHFNERDRNILNEINQLVKELKEEISELKQELSQAKREINQVKSENARRKQSINLNIFAHDDLEQYYRRKNIKVYGAPESSSQKDDGEDVLYQIANELDIELNEWNIQRYHR